MTCYLSAPRSSIPLVRSRTLSRRCQKQPWRTTEWPGRPGYLVPTLSAFGFDAPSVGKARASSQSGGALFVSCIDDAYARQSIHYLSLLESILSLMDYSNMTYYVDRSGVENELDLHMHPVCTVRVVILEQTFSSTNVLNPPGDLGCSRCSYHIRFDRRPKRFTLNSEVAATRP